MLDPQRVRPDQAAEQQQARQDQPPSAVAGPLPSGRDGQQSDPGHRPDRGRDQAIEQSKARRRTAGMSSPPARSGRSSRAAPTHDARRPGVDASCCQTGSRPPPDRVIDRYARPSGTSGTQAQGRPEPSTAPIHPRSQDRQQAQADDRQAQADRVAEIAQHEQGRESDRPEPARTTRDLPTRPPGSPASGPRRAGSW